MVWFSVFGFLSNLSQAIGFMHPLLSSVSLLNLTWNIEQIYNQKARSPLHKKVEQGRLSQVEVRARVVGRESTLRAKVFRVNSFQTAIIAYATWAKQTLTATLVV